MYVPWEENTPPAETDFVFTRLLNLKKIFTQKQFATMNPKFLINFRDAWTAAFKPLIHQNIFIPSLCITCEPVQAYSDFCYSGVID